MSRLLGENCMKYFLKISQSRSTITLKLSQCVIYKYGDLPSIINLWIKYDEHMLYGNDETIIIMKT
jgi:hypothetical protein